jgi:hypothetical protein
MGPFIMENCVKRRNFLWNWLTIGVSAIYFNMN